MALVALGLVAGVVVIMMWLMGVFHPKIGSDPAAVADRPAGRPVGDVSLAEAHFIRVPAVETAVGTIRAVHESSVASKILARVVAVHIRAGDRVEKGQVLIELDDADIRARRDQSVAALTAARAALNQARIEHDRIQRLFDDNAASRIELDRVVTALESAEAEVRRAEHLREEAETILDHATIRAPLDGVVIEKHVEVGDTARPGDVLANLYDPTRMQLVARVRESLAHRLEVNGTVRVHIDAIDFTCDGLVSEIVPEAEAISRTFSVKVTGPCPPGVYSGMFGRLMIPLDEEELLVIPEAAVRRVGQLDMVEVADGDVLVRRAVQLGRHIEGQVEVLAGLRPGERVALPRGPVARAGRT